MILGAAVALLGVALSAPTKGPPPPTAAACTRFRVLAEKNDLAAEGEVAAWVTGALERAALLDEQSPCFVQVRITAIPIRSGGRQDGWVAHVSASTRRFLRDGKLVANEKGMLLVEPARESLVARARTFLEAYVAALKQRRDDPAAVGKDAG